ncbi:substrate-binding domain-containing protein [Brucepastera parasyntrophica]|uniref:LacI family DNA-binding transcriptional regulator n=1 Tax=Brucepastera parasyntrophica TaxID=2880008 RepID=UPI0021086E1F|nr:substrate-binding domain-containing protein [Brucepastera parasyntrophica]ULQ58783.1 substrate-binding domain-containing protein [Brucepastera parasyntrophica]
MAVSIRDVAEKASLSCETILEGLISPSTLDPEVVRFIMKTIRETGYLETFMRWKTGRYTPSVGVITSFVDSPSGHEVFKGIDRAMSALGLNTAMLSFPTRSSPQYRNDLLDNLLYFNLIHAVITMHFIPKPETVKRYRNGGKPLVLMEAASEGAQSIFLDNPKGVSIGMNYLYNKGYKRIGLLNGISSGKNISFIAAERLMGYVQSLDRLGIPFDESLIFETASFDMDGGMKGFEYFASQPDLPDAVFCASGDMTAIGFMRAAKASGIRVPEDIAIMGYDDITVAGLVDPPLTTIRQRLMIAGAAALVTALEAVVNGPGSDFFIMPELVIRETA